jgi:6-pyruvoyltetrahydropterin/6-carboxytetrahydropterin synthase
MGDVLSICKQFRFEAHHKLPWHDGQCARDHGHSYRLDVEVAGPVHPDDGTSEAGMVMDFANLKAVVQPLVDALLDHRSLNDIMLNPTAENMVRWLVAQIEMGLPTGVALRRVRLWETATSYAEWRQA